mmetsp:Transcript_18773/g.13603  ORF Transcript_18773/g.13603 Transcript_18773/m.13603 type:complete len:85 (+) Transcript_18773:621-875(+)
MTERFEDQVEQFIDSSKDFSMKELQSFYKIRTKILHQRIMELNKLVETQNEDLIGARQKYNDNLSNLAGEVQDLRQITIELENL